MATLTADPPAATVPAAGGKSTHKLNNPGTDRLAFKVKSSNNADYTVKPVFGFVEPGGSTDFEITRKGGAAKEDKKVIQFAVVPADATDANAAFTASTVAGSITIAVSAT